MFLVAFDPALHRCSGLVNAHIFPRSGKCACAMGKRGNQTVRMGVETEGFVGQACASWEVFVIEWKLYLQVITYGIVLI